MMLCRSAQDVRVGAKFVLRMDSHGAAERRTHRDYSHPAVADLELSAKPSVLDEPFRLNAGVDVNVRTKAPPIEIGRTQTAQMLQGATCEQVHNVFVVEIARRQKSAALTDFLDLGHRQRGVAARTFQDRKSVV